MKTLALLMILAAAGSLPAITHANTLAAGHKHACAIDALGKLWCWGSDSHGQLGNGDGEQPSASPMPVDDSAKPGLRFVAVTAGRRHTCALDINGKAWCWGSDESGQIGDPDFQVTPGGYSSPRRVENLPDRHFVAITAGGYHTCALEQSQALWCWGNDFFGQLGDDQTFADQVTPQPVSAPAGKSFTAVSAGEGHTCAVTQDGMAWCWGQGTYGRLGNGDDGLDVALPVAVAGGVKFVSIAAGELHTCGISDAGVAWCWGHGHGLFPEPISTGNMPQGIRFANIQAGYDHTCAISDRSSVWCWGGDALGQLGNGPGIEQLPSSMLLPVDFASPSQIAAGAAITCVQDFYGRVACTGSRVEGQLGDGAFGFATVPANTFLTPMLAIATGISHACGLDTSHRAWCWGSNNQGQLGVDSSDRERASPSQVATEHLPPGVEFQSLDTGGYHTCALDQSGAAWCWGNNNYGQLGWGIISEALRRPVPVSMPSGRTFVQIRLGTNHTCALDTAGDVWCWGFDGLGQLGDDVSLADQATPVRVASPVKFKRIGVGSAHACGVGAATGEVHCWGYNARGQLARGADLSNQPVPVAITGVMNAKFTEIDAGGLHTCAVQEIDGNSEESRLWCWGANNFGQIGNGVVSTTPTAPVEVEKIAGSGPATFGRIALGTLHTCAQHPDTFFVPKPVLCWGGNRFGELGDGRRIDSPTYRIAVSFGPGAVLQSIAAGENFTCAIRPDSTFACVGYRGEGSLGDGKTSYSSVPLVIDGFHGLADGIFRDGLETP